MNKINQHPNQLYASELAEICRPLEKLKINYFGHAQIDEQGRLAGLNNNPAFMQHYLENHYYNADIHMAQQSQLGNYVLWDNIVLDKESDKMNREAIEFGIDHTFTIIEKDVKGMQYYHFSSNLIGNAINQEYFRHLDLLQTFILYFKEQIASSKNLRDAYSTTFLLSENSSKFLAEDSELAINKLNERELFLQKIGSNKIITSEIKKSICQTYHSSLSKRESECLSLTMLGKTAKLIGLELGISRRTVEEHLASIKNKIHVFSKAELIEKVMSDCTLLRL